MAHLLVDLPSTLQPALATVAIFTFLLQWNELLRPLIFLSTPEKLPLTVGLAALRSQYSTFGISSWPAR